MYLVFLVQMKEPIKFHVIMKIEYKYIVFLFNIISSWRVVSTYTLCLANNYAHLGHCKYMLSVSYKDNQRDALFN